MLRDPTGEGSAVASDRAFWGWGTPLFPIPSGYRVASRVVMGTILAAWP